MTQPAVTGAYSIKRFADSGTRAVLDMTGMYEVLQCEIRAVNSGDLQRVEALLLVQAHTLDAMFNNLANRGNLNIMSNIKAAETYLRLALKAQSQCRATLEALATVKNPPIVYAKQANITNGPQQVNNGVPAPSHTRRNENQQSKQSGGNNELLPDAGASTLEGGANPQLETVGKVHRAEVGAG
jgi:hypothetical protein